MTRIVHVVESLDRGGLERMVCDLATEQARRGAEVQVICLFREGLLAAELRAAGIAVGLVGKRSGKDLRAVWRLRRMLRSLEPNVVHTHNATAHYHVVLAMVGTGVHPLINTRHGMGGQAGMDRRETWFRWSLRGATTAAVVAVCRYAAESFAARGVVDSGRLTVIPNGICLDRFGAGNRTLARDRLGLGSAARVVGTVGRLNWAKDHALLLAMAARLRTTEPGLRVVIIGAGELREALQQQIADLGLEGCVIMAGDRSDVPELLAAFDVFALSSRTEGYSIALLEAAAAGLPMVVTDVGGNSEIVEDGVTGTVVRHGDVAAFSDAVAALFIDQARRLRQAEAAQRWAASHASLPLMVDRYERLYARATHGSLQ